MDEPVVISPLKCKYCNAEAGEIGPNYTTMPFHECSGQSAARIAALEAELAEWGKEAQLIASKMMERDEECIAERERREAAEAILRDAANCIEGHWLTLDIDAHFARYKD